MLGCFEKQAWTEHCNATMAGETCDVSVAWVRGASAAWVRGASAVALSLLLPSARAFQMPARTAPNTHAVLSHDVRAAARPRSPQVCLRSSRMSLQDIQAMSLQDIQVTTPADPPPPAHVASLLGCQSVSLRQLPCCMDFALPGDDALTTAVVLGSSGPCSWDKLFCKTNGINIWLVRELGAGWLFGQLDDALSG